jgi:hypothetical protein
VCGHRGGGGPDQHAFDATQATVAEHQQPGSACFGRQHLGRVADDQLLLHGQPRPLLGRGRRGLGQASAGLLEQHVPVGLVAGAHLNVGFRNPGEGEYQAEWQLSAVGLRRGPTYGAQRIV